MLKHGVQGNTTTTGTGTVTLSAVAGMSLASARFAVGALMDYAIFDANGNKEWGVGTVGASNTLARTTITGTLAGTTYTVGGTALSLSGSASVACVEHEGSADSGAYAPESYGAIGDGVANDSSAIAAAITAAGIGGSIALTPGNTYLVDRPSTLLTGQTVLGNGATIKRAAQINTTSTGIITHNVTTVIPVASTAGFLVGQNIGASVDTSNYSNAQAVIGSIGANSLTLTSPIQLSNGTTLASGAAVFTTWFTFYLLDDCKVLGLAFNGNKATWTKYSWEITGEVMNFGNRALIDSCYFFNIPGETIEEGGALFTAQKQGCKYTRNVFINCNGNGVHFSGSKGTLVEGNYFNGTNQDTAVGHVGGCVTFSATCNYQRIVNNHMENGYAGVGQMASWSGSFVHILGNTIKGCTNTSINMLGGLVNSGVVDVTIDGNEIINCPNLSVGQSTLNATVTPTATTVLGSSNITLSSYTNVQSGAAITGVGIPANTIIIQTDLLTYATLGNHYGDAVLATATGSPVVTILGTYPQNINITNNIFTNCGIGTQAIIVSNVAGLSINNNMFSYNPTDITSTAILFASASISDVSITGNEFLYGTAAVQGSTFGGTNIRIIGNTVRDCDTSAFNMRPGAPYTSCLITDNVMTTSVLGNGAGAHSGIYFIQAGASTVIKNNMIDAPLSTWGVGISIGAAGSTNCIVQGNSVRVNSNGNTIVIAAGATGAKVINNQVIKAIVDNNITIPLTVARDNDAIL